MIFDDDWLERASQSFPPAPANGADIKVAITLLAGPDGDAPSTWHFAGGSLNAQPGAESEAQIAVTVPYNDALEIVDGKLPPAVAYMQGRLKSTGDNGLLLRLLEHASGPRFAAWRTELGTT